MSTLDQYVVSCASRTIKKPINWTFCGETEIDSQIVNLSSSISLQLSTSLFYFMLIKWELQDECHDKKQKAGTAHPLSYSSLLIN